MCTLGSYSPLTGTYNVLSSLRRGPYLIGLGRQPPVSLTTRSTSENDRRFTDAWDLSPWRWLFCLTHLFYKEGEYMDPEKAKECVWDSQ